MMGSIMPHTELCTLEWLWENRGQKSSYSTVVSRLLTDRRIVMDDNVCLSKKSGFSGEKPKGHF